jgi:hypothetical protein
MWASWHLLGVFPTLNGMPHIPFKWGGEEGSVGEAFDAEREMEHNQALSGQPQPTGMSGSARKHDNI